MKIKIAIIVLAIAAVGLGIALFAIKKQADDQQTKDTATISDLSGQVVNAKKQIDDLGQVNLTYSNDLASSQQLISQVSNQLSSAAATLVETRTSLTSAQGQIASLNSRINDLETQNKVLDQRVVELTNTIAQLNLSIEDTQNQLAIAQTNRVFLEQELQKQIAKRTELERKFNNLDELRAQVKKLREEAYVTRRIQLMKNDNGGKKGAEQLLQKSVTVTPPSADVNYNLNVEVGSDGSVKVIPPLGATNAPATR
jgi:chromosome segregation ATPase